VKKVLGIILIFMFFAGLLGRLEAVLASPIPNGVLNSGDSKIDPQVQAVLDASAPEDRLTVIVTLVDQADLSRIPGANRAARLQGIIRALQALAEASQRQILAQLDAYRAQGKVGLVIPYWVFNGLSVNATADVIQELAARDDVRMITPDEISVIPETMHAANPPETNLALINAPALWDLGYQGQGIVVANMDSGVDLSHPDLSTRWRGGSNSWFDPYGQHPTTPTDLSGHGTWTMGLMAGGDSGGTSIGVAPQAQWVAVKIFNDAGAATASAIHAGFQWLLDPDGNPNTADAPHVVNNSWAYGSPGCNLEFQLDLQALQAAWIVPVFAAGNYGPGSSTSVSPANYPEAFAVGATNNTDQMYAYSSRGPSACGESQTIYPEMVAPADPVRTTGLFGTYTSESGTSLAAPQAAGGLALLLNVYPNLSADQQESALILGAVDLGTAGADNDTGYGRLDLLAAYQWLQAGGANPTPTPTPLPTATPVPTVNLALNRPVSVSSYQDSSSGGAMAVDGNLATFWKTARANGRNTLPAEWITVDLGSSQTVGEVILEWDANYATSYTLQVSNNNSSWSTVLSISNGNGANDTLTFAPTSARYLKLNTTAWSSGSQRDWLRELQVYAGSSAPPTPNPTAAATATVTPTATAVPTTTATPTAYPSPTATPGTSTYVHVGDLDGSTSPGNRGRWNAVVTISVHNSSEAPVAGASVSGSWSGGASGSGSCQTGSSGTCTVSLTNLKSNAASVTFTVSSVAAAGGSYQPSANHDPDGDSSGTAITVLAP
jgi:subtilisin family serine protease